MLRQLRRGHVPRAVHVVVDWSAAGGLGAKGHVELEAELAASPRPVWACLQPDGWEWEEALSTSRCDEVVLTAQAGDDSSAKDVVLGLAEHLTHKLAKTQPLIRVVFLPARSKRA